MPLSTVDCGALWTWALALAFELILVSHNHDTAFAPLRKIRARFSNECGGWRCPLIPYPGTAVSADTTQRTADRNLISGRPFGWCVALLSYSSDIHSPPCCPAAVWSTPVCKRDRTSAGSDPVGPLWWSSRRPRSHRRGCRWTRWFREARSRCRSYPRVRFDL